MKQLQLYKYTTWALLVLNIFMISFFFITKPKHRPPRRGNFRNNAAEILKLNENQHATFIMLAEQHGYQMDSIRTLQNALLQPYFESLVNNTNNTYTDDLLKEFQQLEGKKITLTYQHFNEVKEILNPSQQPHFKEFMQKVLRNILLGKKKNPPPPKDF